MPSICEACPIRTKARICCKQDPETGAVKIIPVRVRNLNTGLVRTEEVVTCPSLQRDGSCSKYFEKRPEECVSFGCEAWYERGLGGNR